MRTRSRRSRLLVVLALATLPVACGEHGSLGDHVSDDLVFFEWSDSETSRVGEIYAGLQCIAWDTTDPEVTRIDLFNFGGDGSIPPWQGEASVEPDGTVELRILALSCDTTPDGAGNYHDFNFGVANVPANDELALRLLVGIEVCDGVPAEPPDPRDQIEVSLPQGSEPKGAICRYAVQNEACPWSFSGTVFMDCRGGSDEPGAPPPCDEGLACAVGGDVDRPVCHPTCEVDEDCPWDGVLACQDGLCRPANPW